MGKQINFYFGSRDELEFLDCRFLNEAVFISHESSTNSIEMYNEFQLNPTIREVYSQLNICRPSYFEQIKFREVPTQEIYFIDPYDNPVIEFIRSGYKEDLNLLISGRLWYQHKYWGKDRIGKSVILTKSEELNKLYNSLAGWIRRHSTPLPNGRYIGPHAKELLEKGAELSQI
jgi:hypothetical protein